MNHNFYQNSYENEAESYSDGVYNQWQETMKDLEFHGAQSSNIIRQANESSVDNTEIHDKSSTKIEKLFGKIQNVKELIKKKIGISEQEKITEMADDALLYVAKKTISSADEDGVRTETESAAIEEAVSSVVVQGAMEEAGLEHSNGDNPILELNKDGTRTDLESSIEDLHKEGAVLSGGESVAGLAVRAIERDKKWDLKKVGDRLGSNEGGWYEKPNGERFYVKFYENPSQGRVEFISNAIYAKLGIKAVRSEMIQLDGREAIASRAVPGAVAADRRTQIGSEDVRKGFVADAFLANWDVVGLVYDNIVQGEDGLYRIDNGGSMIFRALGDDKDYSPNSIPELKSMRVPGRPSGEVFASITEDEIRKQAQELVSRLSPEDVRTIVDMSGLEGEERRRVLTGLLGRREYLAKTYGEPGQATKVDFGSEHEAQRPRRSVSETVRMLRSEEMERSGEILLRPRSEIICDRDHIEDQRIDVINKIDCGKMEFRFKLRTPTDAVTAIVEGFKEEKENNSFTHSSGSMIRVGGKIVRRDEIVYEDTSSDKKLKLCDAYVFEKNGAKVFIADPASRNNGKEEIYDGYSSRSGLVRTAMGLVKVETPLDMEPEEVEQLLNEIMEKDLGIPNAFSEVSEKAERDYKIARYKWQYKITGDLTPEQIRQAEKLEREEVFPGYMTFVEKGKHEEYLAKYGEDMRAIHSLFNGDAEAIYQVLTSGLLGTTERLSVGCIVEGLSSREDIDTGGADSVFTRIYNSKMRKKYCGGESVVVLKPEVFDRMDWYSYKEDMCGTTDGDHFKDRLSPDALFAKIADSRINHGLTGNEQMFRIGIGASFIECIDVDSDSRDKIIAELKAMNLNEVDGRPIEEIITLRGGLLPEVT